MYKVMLVDDEYMILEGLKQIIPWSELGFEVVKTAKRGQEALDYLNENEVDLLITDVTMPKMSGIDLVRQVRKLYPHLRVLILSGYQEFEYVKQGMELGVKGYLVKPVNKAELAEKVTQIKGELEEEELLDLKKEFYYETMIQKWLNDEINEDEFFSFLDELNHTVNSAYSVLIINQYDSNISLKSYAKKYNQPFIIQNDSFYQQQTIIIYEGNRSDLNLFVRGIEEKLAENHFKIILGESVSDWDNVYESFEKAKKIALFDEFYGSNDQTKTVVKLTDTDDEEAKLHFLSFNKALMIGDMTTIKDELEDIYEQMRAYRYSPENVRHVTFLLFTDIYRQFPTLDKEIYDDTLTKIHTSNSIHDLKKWLSDILDTLYENPDMGKRYSDLVAGAINIIATDFKMDLSLKIAAERLHVNPVYLGQLFSKETERSFSQYLNQTRIKKAQYGLLNTNKPINEVGYDVGYNNPTYFFKMFRKLNGLTPKEFREKYMTNYQSVEEDKENQSEF
ncbi:response regulator transcription factor [Vagococcus fluvialis]|uniref:response regulator transcription factor n=1 Tax=Vagococcus fluvialis TaxID=2738 RepID=UPI0032E4E317